MKSLLRPKGFVYKITSTHFLLRLTWSKIWCYTRQWVCLIPKKSLTFAFPAASMLFLYKVIWKSTHELSTKNACAFNLCRPLCVTLNEFVALWKFSKKKISLILNICIRVPDNKKEHFQFGFVLILFFVNCDMNDEYCKI